MRDMMKNRSNIIESFKMLKGNTRVSVICEPMWGIPFVLYNFYLSLYMKELGITSQQFGYLIAIGYFAGAIFSLFAGVITDKLGRKKTTLIFDLISWPCVMILYIFAHSFWMFAIATIINNSVRIAVVSWNLMVIEDANSEQRISAFNLINVICVATGIFVPIAGLLVHAYGVIHAEQIFLLFAAISMTIMMFVRNHFYQETTIGKKALQENHHKTMRDVLKTSLSQNVLATLLKSPMVVIVISVMILFNIYLPLGGFNSLYFAPFMTEVLSLSKSSISILGGVYSFILIIVFVFINPIIGKFNKTMNMIIGLCCQASALFLFTIIPSNNLVITSLCIILFASGFGIFKPFIDPLMAEVTEGENRAGLYSMMNTIICIGAALTGVLSGNLYAYNPKLLYLVSSVILLLCIGLLILLSRRKDKKVEKTEV